MSAFCIIDTTVLLEILDVPGKAQAHQNFLRQFREKTLAGEKIFFPLAVIIETGNHIAQSGNGEQRRQRAQQFKEMVQGIWNGTLPFGVIQYIVEDRLREVMSNFPDCAMRGFTLADYSIQKDWELMHRRHPGHPVYIWSKDRHLQGFHYE